MKSKNILLSQMLPQLNAFGSFENHNIYELANGRQHTYTFPNAYDPASLYASFRSYIGNSVKSYLARLYRDMAYGGNPSSDFYSFLNGNTEGPMLDKLMGDFILPRLCNVVVCVVDDWDDPLNDEANEDYHCALFYSKQACDRFSKMLHWLYEDGEERIKLISLLQSNLNNLLNKVETINVRRDNNTPQNATTPDADSHLSFYSKNVNSTDLTTLMARIKEIKDNIYDEYEEWATAFEKKFAIMCL